MLERYNGIEPDPEGAYVLHADAQATIADLQGQLKEMTESQKRCWNEWTLAEQNVESLQQRVAQLEALKLGKEVGACEHCLYCVWESCAPDVPNAVEMKCSNGSTWWRCWYCFTKQRVALLEGENKALVDAHRDFKVHLSHCNFGEHAQVCKYGREETCPALMPSWVWFGNALQRSEALQADHATLLGLVQEREYEIKRRIWAMHGSRMGHQLYGDDGRLDCNTCFRKYSDESLETVYGFELYDANVLCAKAASLPAQPAQGGA